MTSILTALAGAVLVGSAPPALAVDGVVLINENTSVAGLPGCPTGGHFPIVICQSGSYRLAGNLTVPDADTTAILITSINVTLDLNGFSISGPTTCSFTACSPTGIGMGIDTRFPSLTLLGGPTVLNGTVQGMGSTGINLGTSVASRVEGVQAIGNGEIGIAAAGIVRNNIVSSNGLIGIEARNAVVSGNQVVGNFLDGLVVDCPSNVVDNAFLFNVSNNLIMHGSGCNLSNNSVFP
jgi:hypothetical protein